ncbi:MAG: DUF1848 domain-containing protein [Bacilli bacterium]|jgi:hypothetical protein|nr:DUF1848 domain-containing protein [Bacilli bacterium]
MILNVSGRTDIIAFYSQWFMNRYQEGYVDVRNPFYPKMISRIFFQDVDAILFCIKNPLPFLSMYSKITHPFVLQVTLTPYQNDIEVHVYHKDKIIEAIKEISYHIGVENIYIRYDPIFFSVKYDLDYHCKAFEKMCRLLSGSVKHFIVSFLDLYRNVQIHAAELQFHEPSKEELQEFAVRFIAIAKKYNMTIQTCAEEERFGKYGFLIKDCVDQELAQRLTGKTKFRRWKARGRENCQCVEMVDIGVYNTCKHLCKYCYANFEERKIEAFHKQHDSMSSLLIGNLKPDDIIRRRKA